MEERPLEISRHEENGLFDYSFRGRPLPLVQHGVLGVVRLLLLALVHWGSPGKG